MSNEVLIRNFNLMKNIFDNLEVLTVHYKLSQRDINIVQSLLTKHNTYNAYVDIKTTMFPYNRRVVYRGLDKLQEKKIITIVSRPHNQYGSFKIYFTVSFINQVCGEEFADLYSKWLDWQMSFKDDKKGEESNGSDTSREN